MVSHTHTIYHFHTNKFLNSYKKHQTFNSLEFLHRWKHSSALWLYPILFLNKINTLHQITLMNVDKLKDLTADLQALIMHVKHSKKRKKCIWIPDKMDVQKHFKAAALSNFISCSYLLLSSHVSNANERVTECLCHKENTCYIRHKQSHARICWLL